MKDQTWRPDLAIGQADDPTPSGVLQRALYLWERQSPSESRLPNADIFGANGETTGTLPDADPDIGDLTGSSSEIAIEEHLKRHAGRLAALERIIPGDKRLDPPRFSLMMLNAFLGRAVTEGLVSARLPGLSSICDRIDSELSDLEFEYPAALDQLAEASETVPSQIRDEMRVLFADLKSRQKAQQRQIVSSLSALHAAISDLQSKLPDPDFAITAQSQKDAAQPMAPPIDDLARPLVDPEKLVDPRPILAAARAAASRATAEPAPVIKSDHDQAIHMSAQRPYRSVLLGSAVLGLLIVIFGRDAAQFLSTSSLTTGALARP